MKKIFIYFLIIILCCSTISCNKKSPVNNNITFNISKEILQSDNYQIYYPIIENEIINQYIYQEITELTNRIEENYLFDKLTIDYDCFYDERFVSLVFHIDIDTNKIFYRSYNFDYLENQSLYIEQEKLQTIYLNYLNEEVKPKKITYSFLDILGLNYIIQKDAISFIIPELSTKENFYEVRFDNSGYNTSIIGEKTSNNNKKVVITFDDGPSSKTLKLIELLNKYEVKASFFVVGQRIEEYPEHLRALYKNNFELGNHSYSHSDFSKISKEEIEFEINFTQNMIYQIVGIYPRTFRFPYGAFNPLTLPEIKLPIILWNVDSLDWKNKDRSITLNNVFNNLVNESVILFHDSENMDLSVIEEVIIKLKDKNYEFTTIYELYNFRFDENLVFGKIYR